MRVDRQLRMSWEQAVTASAASTDLINLGYARQMGPGRPLWVVALVTTAMSDTGSNSTIAVTLETETDASFGSATTAQTIGTFAATSAAGTRFIVPLATFTTAEQFLRGYYTTANGDLSGGAFSLFLTPDPDDWTAYPNGITIS